MIFPAFTSALWTVGIFSPCARLGDSLLSTGGVVLGIVLLLGEERAVALGNGGVDGGGDLDLQTDHKRRQKKEEEV